MMAKQAEIQLKLGNRKLEITQVEGMIAQLVQAQKSQTQMTLAASQWVIDLAASVRPLITYCLFFEFLGLTLLVSFDFMTDAQYRMIWNNEFQAVWASVVAFWFGQRTFNRK